MCFVYTNNRSWSGDAYVGDERISRSLIKIKHSVTPHSGASSLAGAYAGPIPAGFLPQGMSGSGGNRLESSIYTYVESAGAV